MAVTFGPEFEAYPRDAAWVETTSCFISWLLFRLGERSLWPLAPDTEVYRFTWLRSFLDDVSIRVERRGAVYQIRASWEEDGIGPGAPRSAGSRSRLLSPSEWAELQRRLARFGFWERRAWTEGPWGDWLDGSEWVLEGGRGGRYRSYLVFSPNETTEAARAYRDVCLYLVTLSDLSIPPDEVY
ncbi:hypothetical protein ACN469_14880 [Corallococcus terminator]